MNERMKINTLVTFVLIFLMIGVSIQFLMPLHLINPYEYFYGNELKEYQVYRIFFGGVLLPLVSLLIGFLVTRFEHSVKPLILSILVLFFIALMWNGQDLTYLAALSGLIVVLFRKRSILITLSVFAFLIIAHVFINALIPALSALNTNNIVYSAIQRFNDYVSTFRTGDLIEYAKLNFTTIQEMPLVTLFLFIAVPSALIGSVIARMEAHKLFSSLMISIIVAVLLLGGLVVKLIEVLSVGTMSSTIIGEFIGGPMFAIGIFLLFLIISEHLPEKVSKLFNGVLKHSVIMYLVYTLIMMIVFYGIGFNLYGEVQVWIAVLISVGIAVASLAVNKILTKS